MLTRCGAYRCWSRGNGHRTTFLFDADSRDAGSIDPLSRRVTSGYDAASKPDQYFANGKLRLPVSSHRGGMAGQVGLAL
jgi:hypothetical protein